MRFSVFYTLPMYTSVPNLPSPPTVWFLKFVVQMKHVAFIVAQVVGDDFQMLLENVLVWNG